MKPHLQGPFGCHTEFALELLGGKWTTVLLAHLKQSPRRYAELQQRVPRISDKMLTQRLQELQDKGFIAQVPPGRGHPYRLTERGESLRPVLERLYTWGQAQAHELGVHIETLELARARQNEQGDRREV